MNGHGGYTPDRVLNINSYPNDYSIFFPCRHREAVTVSHHNLIFADLTTCPKDQIVTRLQIMEGPMTVSVVNKQAPALGLLTDMITTLIIYYQMLLRL